MPAQEVQVGDAVLWGMRNDGTEISISGYVTFILDGMKLSHDFETEYVKDGLGFDRSAIATNAMKKLDVTFVPSGEDRDAAEAVATSPVPLQKVTIANVAVEDFNGDYMYEGGGTIDLSQKVGKQTLKLRKYDDADQNASMTTTVA